MNKVIHGLDQKVPIKMWLDDIEEGALSQAKNLANLPFAFKHVAIMPDAHQGYGMPIGGVLATKNVVVPNAVGVDIGCGMSAVKTYLTELSTNTLKTIMGEIIQVIPVGFNHQKEPVEPNLMPHYVTPEEYPIISNQFNKALSQLGTLGGGNHFIEIQKSADGYIWIMVHSGSRNLGKQVADHYNRVATMLNEKWCAAIPPQYDLAFLPLDSAYGRSYLAEMEYCVKFALANRKLMMYKIKGIFNDLTQTSFGMEINIAHNYARLEHHFGQEVVVHRKGATSAREGELGIIPGSQGTKSYIVKGLGNKESFESCSHGAGRRMGRKEAERSLNLENEIKNLDDKGILHSIRGVKDLDEAPGAYKNINVVMDNQKDLVSIEVELTPMSVIKG